SAPTSESSLRGKKAASQPADVDPGSALTASMVGLKTQTPSGGNERAPSNPTATPPAASSQKSSPRAALHARAYPVPNWDRFEPGEFIGEGGMGRVYKARDPRLNRYVALKFLRGGDPQQVRRFIREAQTQARIDHAHICKVHEVGEVEGMPYIAMAYI